MSFTDNKPKYFYHRLLHFYESYTKTTRSSVRLLAIRERRKRDE